MCIRNKPNLSCANSKSNFSHIKAFLSFSNAWGNKKTQLLRRYDENKVASESYSYSDDRKSDSSPKHKPFASTTSDRGRNNLWETKRNSLANTVETNEVLENGDATEDFDEDSLEQNVDDNDTWEEVTFDIRNP